MVRLSNQKARKILWASPVLVALLCAVACDVRYLYPPCDVQPRTEDIEAAKGAHSAASRFYEKAEYDKAIDLWSYAYDLDCTAHRLLVNIGKAYETKGQRERAIEVYELYIERTGPEADPAIVEKVKAARQQVPTQPWEPGDAGDAGLGVPEWTDGGTAPEGGAEGGAVE